VVEEMKMNGGKSSKAIEAVSAKIGKRPGTIRAAYERMKL
jgi:hypothetical protein